ncbi:sphX [Symbiodinium natans]|uniref:SphX protein n=1 Tax=Symbiodinium natans TaxID=878477 RepID=A0A812HTY2_9DINO|nr:sphX [Symbiodinium natans]
MRYVTSVVCWPVALAWLVVCGLVSKLGPQKLHFVKAKALSTLGQLFQIGFTIIAKTALMPFMCYSHPNGKSSVLRFSDVICWEEETGHTTMVIFGVVMTGIMLIYWVTLLWSTIQAPRRSANADLFFLQATRFLFFRFRTDYWWYGTWFILRGPLLSLPVVIFTDLPQVQLFVMTAVLETYMVVQLMTWPWKTPLINLADGAMSMMMILLLSIGSAFLDALEGQVKATYSSLAMGVLGILYSIAFVLLSLVVVAMVHTTAMGSANELPILLPGRPLSKRLTNRGNPAIIWTIRNLPRTLGRPPSNSMLREAALAFVFCV